MSEMKYRIIENEPVQLFGRTLYRIVAVKSFVLRPVKGNSIGRDKYPGLIVKRGETGGLIEGEWNLRRRVTAGSEKGLRSSAGPMSRRTRGCAESSV